MSKPSYPIGSDLEHFLQGAGLVASPSITPSQAQFDYDNAVQAAIDAMEDGSGWKPILSTTQTRSYDPPGPYPMRGSYWGLRGGGRFLEMDAGLLSTDPVVTVGIVPGVAGTGTVFVIGTQYYLRPNNADLNGRPFTYIEFVAPVFGQAQSITVEGDFGYAAALPDGIWRAILQKAAVNLGSELAANLSQGLVQWQGDVTVQYGPDPLGRLLDRWEEAYDTALARFRRLPLGLD